MGSRRAGDQSGAGYRPSVPMVTAVCPREKAAEATPVRVQGTALAAGARAPRSDAGASRAHPGLESSLPVPHTHRPLQKPCYSSAPPFAGAQLTAPSGIELDGFGSTAAAAAAAEQQLWWHQRLKTRTRAWAQLRAGRAGPRQRACSLWQIDFRLGE